jgi:hypothetical protein
MELIRVNSFSIRSSDFICRFVCAQMEYLQAFIVNFSLSLSLYSLTSLSSTTTLNLQHTMSVAARRATLRLLCARTKPVLQKAEILPLLPFFLFFFYFYSFLIFSILFYSSFLFYPFTFYLFFYLLPFTFYLLPFPFLLFFSTCAYFFLLTRDLTLPLLPPQLRQPQPPHQPTNPPYQHLPPPHHHPHSNSHPKPTSSEQSNSSSHNKKHTKKTRNSAQHSIAFSTNIDHPRILSSPISRRRRRT